MGAITIFRGDSYPITFTIKDKATGLPIPLTGATFKMTVDRKQNPTDTSTKVFEVAGVVNADPVTGKVTFTPSSANTATVGNFYFDVQMTQGGAIRTVVKDAFIISQDITK